MAVLTPLSVAAGADNEAVPLVVDLDDTLVLTDSTIESLFVLARRAPLRLASILMGLARGAAHFKERLSAAAMPDVHTLPMRADLLALLKEQRLQGRLLVLATAADAKLAQAIARETEVFDRVIASDGVTNLRGAAMRQRLVAEFGHHGFDYVGSRRRDHRVWSAARKAWLVSPSPRLAREVANVASIERIVDGQPTTLGNLLNAVRAHHWVKNLLVLLPVAAAHRIFALDWVAPALTAFVAFSLCASSVYLLNDLLDLPVDRQHPQKKDRMLALGQIRPPVALGLMLSLLVCAAALALYLSAAFFGVLTAYFLLMMAYSVGLKDIPLLDVSILSGGYALRVLGGAVAASIVLSYWLLAFVILLFYSFALVKRTAEVLRIQSPGLAEAARVCGYRSGDAVILMAQGIASGYLAVLVLALYANTEIIQPYYPRHEYFWGFCILLLYWINYLWLTVARRLMHHDPVTFVLNDPLSRWLLVAMGVIAVIIL